MSEQSPETTEQPVTVEPDETAQPDDTEQDESEADDAGENEPEGPGETPGLSEDDTGQTGESPAALSERDMEKALDKLNREGERHANRVREIMGASAGDLTLCELCWPFAPGFRFQVIPDEQRAAVMLALGLSETANYALDKRAQACGDCNGWGMVATGSKVQGQEALPCTNCGGRGWMGERGAVQVPALATSESAPAGNGTTATHTYPADVQDAIEIARNAGVIVIEPSAPAPAT